MIKKTFENVNFTYDVSELTPYTQTIKFSDQLKEIAIVSGDLILACIRVAKDNNIPFPYITAERQKEINAFQLSENSLVNDDDNTSEIIGDIPIINDQIVGDNNILPD